MRCGFIAAPPRLDRGLIDLKIATTFGGGRLSAELVLTLLRDGSYRKHMESLRARLSQAMGETVARLKAIGITPWIEPQAGMFLWCRCRMASTRRSRAARAGRERRARAGQCLQPVADGRRLHALQRRAVEDERIFTTLQAAMRANAPEHAER